MGLGKYFAEKSDYHKHTHEEIYQIAFEYLERHYAHDKILKQLFAIDYYLQHKIKPKMLFIEEVEGRKKSIDRINETKSS